MLAMVVKMVTKEMRVVVVVCLAVEREGFGSFLAMERVRGRDGVAGVWRMGCGWVLL
jgi:hypothetical protein